MKIPLYSFLFIFMLSLGLYNLLLFTYPLSFIYLFYWSIIALQCCVSFCCAVKWISYMYIYIYISPPSWTFLPPHLGHPRAPSWAPCAVQQVPTSYFTQGSVYMSVLISQFVPPSPSPRIHMSVLYVCVSIPALHIGSSVPFF